MSSVAIVKAPDRECGTCTLCCKLMAIQEINKREDVWCTHCSPKAGCSIHGNPEYFPKSCGDFICLWLAGVVPEELRPDKSGFLCYMDADEKTVVVKVKDEPMSEAKEERMNALIKGWLLKGLNVTMVKGPIQSKLGLR